MNSDMLERSRYLPLKQAVDTLAGVCDGAIKRDDAGYNGPDARFGHLLAFLDLEAWPPSAFHKAWSMLRKYRRQLAQAGICYDDLPEPPCLEAHNRFISLHPTSVFLVVFPYDPEMIAAFWRIVGAQSRAKPVHHYVVREVPGVGEALMEFAERYGFELASGVRERAELLSSEYLVTLEHDACAVYFPRDQALNAEIKAIPGWSYARFPSFHWVIPMQPISLKALRAFLSRHEEFMLTPELTQRWQELDQHLRMSDRLS